MRDLPNLSVHQLLYVREAARASTWSDAARRLGVTQPALSQGVAEVERRLGIKLFDRRARLRTPTAELADVLAVAELVLASVDDLGHRLDELRTGGRGVVRIGMIDTVALGTLAPTVAAFRAVHPNVTVTIVVEPSLSLSERVAAGELDLAVVVVPNPVTETLGRRLSVTAMFTEGIYIYPAVPATARPVGQVNAQVNGQVKRKVNAQVTGQVNAQVTRKVKVNRPQDDPHMWGPWVTYPAGSQSRALIAAALAARDIPMRVVAESSNPDVLRQMVRLGVGWCALPQEVAEGGVSPLVRLPGEALAHRNIAAIRRRDALPNASAEILYDSLVAAAPLP